MTVAKMKRIEELVEFGFISESVLQAFIDEWDPIICVDRSIRPEYPDFVKEVKHQDLELAGSAEFDVRKLRSYLHSKQKNGYVVGNEIYEELLAKEMLEDCLNLSDIRAIQVRGIGFFRKHFAGKHLSAWASVVLFFRGTLHVPYLYENGDEVKLDWAWIDCYFDSIAPVWCRVS